MNTLSTGKAAKLAGVAQQTLIRWIDSGRLPGFRIPGGNGGHEHRRVTRESLVKFLEEHGMPLGELAGDGEAVRT